MTHDTALILETGFQYCPKIHYC